MSTLQIQTPRVFVPLLKPARYKGAHGGRGSGKSHFFAEYSIEEHLMMPLRRVVLREVQKSIKQSIKLLLEDKIKHFGVQDYFEILEQEIRIRKGAGKGGLIIFQGMQNHTADSIKSLEGFDRANLVEAQSFSQRSLDMLRPTIRKEGSEIWAEWNPDEDSDAIDNLLRGVHKPKDSIVVEANYADNPFFPEVLRKEMEEDKVRDFQKYLHVWMGGYNIIIDGAIFAAELTKAQTENRITIVRPVAGVPVQTYWDLGQSDNTCIWFIQQVGLEFRVLEYYENSGPKFGHYIDELAKRDYLYHEHFLPHDANHEQLAAQQTIKEQLEEALRLNPKLGKEVTIVPRIPKKALGIEMARKIFEQCLFDKEKTKAGMKCLKNFAYAKDVETGKISKEPKHDIWSHGADGFLCFAQHKRQDKKEAPLKYQRLGNV